MELFVEGVIWAIWCDLPTIKVTFASDERLLQPSEQLTIILRNRAEYRLILGRRGRRPS